MPIVARPGEFKPSDPFGLYRDRPNPFAPAPAPAVDPEEERRAAEIRAAEEANAAVDAQYTQLEQSEPGRYAVIDQPEMEQWQTEWQARQPGWLEDTARILGGSLAKGGGAVVSGLGNAITALTNATTTPVINEIFGTDYGQANPLGAPAEWLNTLGEKTQEGVSYATREAIANSTPDGDLLDPSTWTLGKDPSLVGYSALALDVFGQMTPVIAAAVLTGPAGGAVVGGLQGGGAASQQAAALIDQMAAEPGLLEKESAFYREQIAAGRSHEEALAATKAAAEQTAFLLTAPISGLGGYATGKILDPAAVVLAGRNLVTRIAGRAGLSALEEGTQEAAETAATTLGTNIGAGTDLSLTDGTFADFVLGALGGAAPGAVAGGLSRREPGTADAVEPAPAPAEPVVPPASQTPAAQAPATKPAGPLTRAVENGLAAAPPAPAAEPAPVEAAPRFIVNDPPLPGMGAGAAHGQVVTLAPDQTGIDPAMARVVLEDGSERIIGKRLLQSEGGTPMAADPQGAGQTFAPLPRAPGLPGPGARAIVNIPDLPQFNATIEQFVENEDGSREAIIVDDEGEVLQVPVDALSSLNLSDAEVAALERQDNPPPPMAEMPQDSTSRLLTNAEGAPTTVKFPDETLAQLYDLGAERERIMRLNRATGEGARADVMADHAPDKVRALAEQLGVPEARINEIADDYRFRVQRAARKGIDGGTTKAFGLNPEKLRAWQAERSAEESSSEAIADEPSSTGLAEMGGNLAAGIGASLRDHLWALAQKGATKEAGIQSNLLAAAKRVRDAGGLQTREEFVRFAEEFDKADSASAGAPNRQQVLRDVVQAWMPRTSAEVLADVAPADPDAAWWDALQPGARKTLLAAAKVKRSEKSSWDKFSKAIKAKLAPLRAEMEGLEKARERSRALDEAAHEADVGTAPQEVEPNGDDSVEQYQRWEREQTERLETLQNSTTPLTADDEAEIARIATALADRSNFPDVADAIGEQAVEKARQNRAALDDAAHEAATSPENGLAEPSIAQKEAGNYKLGHHRLGGLDLSIENPAGSERKGQDKGGKPWSVTMKSHYGYIKGTVGKDKDHIDVFVKPGTEALDDSAMVTVINQVGENGRFDEHKVMLGFSSQAEAEAAYMENYTKGWKGKGSVGVTTLGEFKSWLKDGDTTKPFGSRGRDGEAAKETEPGPGGPFDTATEVPKDLVGLLRTNNALERLQRAIADGASNATLLDLWDEHVGSALAGRGGDRTLLQARGRTLEVTMPSADGSKVVRKVFKGGDLVQLIRSAVALAPEPSAPSGTQADKARLETAKAINDAASSGTKEGLQQARKLAEEAKSKPDGKIEDFGEELIGARKHLAREIGKRLDEQLDVAALPLSEAFPRPDYVKLAAEGVPAERLAAIAILRDMIPPKPRKSYRVKDWTVLVERARKAAARLLNDDGVSIGDLVSEPNGWQGPLARTLALTSTAIQHVDPARLEAAARWRIKDGDYSVFNGVRHNPPKHLYFVEDENGRYPFGGERAQAYDDTADGIVEKARALIDKALEKAAEQKPEKGARLTPVAVYRDRATQEIFIAFKVRSSVIRIMGGFDSVKLARQYVEDNRDEVQAKIDAMREGPVLRNAENRERTGRDMRDGDISPEMFSDAFGFRGVQFGNYVEGPRRQTDLNRAYDALMDLADVVGVPPRALALNGGLGLAFGARGTGGKSPAAAHYEPGTMVINLTKNAGPGSLAHEWFHALDNYFAREDEGGGFMTERKRSEGPVRQKVYDAWKAVERAINAGIASKTSFFGRALEADKTRSKPYYSTTIELAARAFERYVVDRLGDAGVINDYLANINLDGGAYPTSDEMMGGIRQAFDNLFEVMETAETEKGVRLYSRRPSGESGPVAMLDGSEVGIDFNGPEDMPALRRAAVAWYDANLVGTSATMKDGTEVRFNKRGRRESTHGGKGDRLLRAVPAIRAIIEQGEVVLREPGDRSNVAERIVISAPVSLAGDVLPLAVSVHKTPDGHFQYDFTWDRDGGGPGVGVPGRLAKQSMAEVGLEGAPIGFNIGSWPARSKAASAPDGIRQALRRAGLGSMVDALEQADRLRIIRASEDAYVQPGMQGWTDPDGTITLVADQIEGDPVAVLLHEAFHSGAQDLLGSSQWRQLMIRLAGLFRQFEQSKGRAREFYDAARDRVRAAEDSGDQLTEGLRVEEFAAYAIEEHATAPAALAKWVDDLLGAIKAWALRRFGRQIGTITPAQLAAIARQALATHFETDTGRRAMASRRKSIAAPSSLNMPKWDRQSVTDAILGKLTDLKPAMMAAIPLNYFTELKRPGMVAVDHYLKVKRMMDAYRGEKHANVDEIAQQWQRYAGLGIRGDKVAGKSRAAELADLMHETTLAGVDPSKTDDEMKAKPGYDTLRKRFLALPKSGQALYQKVRDTYQEQADEMDQILLDNVKKTQEIAFRRAEDKYRQALDEIAASGKTGLDKSKLEHDAQQTYSAEMRRATMNMKARMTKLRLAFEASRVPAPYFPLARFGQYFVSVKDLDGTVISFSRRETDADRRRLERDMRAAHPTARIESGRLPQNHSGRDMMDPRIVAEIESLLGDAGVDTKVMDQIWQRYLETMPDLSARKRFIHRKGVAGFEGDALRAFASNQFHAAHQMARLKYGLELTELTNQAVDQAKAADDPVRGVILADELKRRHEWVMNPTGSRAVQAVTSSMFVWYLAASPAAALVNMAQTPMMALPVLGARLGGMGKATAALLRASGDIMRGKGTALRSQLTEDERKAMEAFYESGMIDRTQAHDLAGVGEVGVAYSPLRHKVMSVISWAYHNVEVWNREVTALAAYRLAREQGHHQGKAIDIAHELTWMSHFDYSNASRPRAMQGDVQKLALVFMSHQVNMWYRLFRDIHQSVKGETPQARKEARYQLAGIMGMTALFSGVTGLFGYNVLMALLGLAFDDDDDPRKFQDEVEGHIVDLLGPDLGGMVLKGVPGHLTGVDLTSRLGMPDFFVRAPDSGAEGREWFQELIVNAFGVVPSTLINGVDGAGLIMQGDVARGLEVLAPKGVKDIMQAWRYANEGVLSRRGDTYIDREQISPIDVAIEALGFTPAKVAETYERMDALKDAEQRVLDERRELMNRFALAVATGDPDARRAAIEAIKRWNRKPYAKMVPITGDSLTQSLKARARNAGKREDGVLIPDPELNRYLRELMPEHLY